MMSIQESRLPWSLPEGWQWVTLGQIATIINGLSYENHQIQNEPAGDSCLIIRSGNIQNGQIVFGKTEVYLPKDVVCAEQFVQQGDVLIVSSTGSKRSIGKAGLVATDLPLASFGAFLYALRPGTVVDRCYFSYFFLTRYYRKQVAGLARGSSINNLKRNQLSEMKFPLPPKAEQERIAERLNGLFAKLKEANKLIEEGLFFIEQAREALMEKVFRGELSPGSEVWPSMPLGSLIQLRAGDALSRIRMNQSGCIPVYGGNGVSGMHDESNTDHETIVIGRVGTNCGCVHLTAKQAWITDNALVVGFDENRLHRLFLCYALEYMQLRQYSNSSAQPVISGKAIYPLLLRLPPLVEQRRLAALMGSFFARLQQARQLGEQAEMELVEQTVLQQAFEGKLA